MRMLPFFKPKKGFMIAGGGLDTAGGGGGGGGGSSVDYSTTKFDTRKKWIDGRTIYGIVVSGNLPNTTSETTIATISTMDLVVSMSGVMHNKGSDYDNVYNMDFYQTDSNNARFVADLVNKEIKHAHESSVFNGMPFHAIIEFIETE